MGEKGLFITFEGGEGSGKTTQMELLGRVLGDRGLPVLLTREPGGTPLGKEIRGILLDGKNQHMVPLTELLLYAADRAQHVVEVLEPALEKGQIVICDRYEDSTRVYQGVGRGLDPEYLDELLELCSNGLIPHRTLLLDLPPEVGLQRSRSRLAAASSNEDRFEQENLEFHQKVRQGFLELARQESDRFRVLDATGEPELIHQKILKSLEDLLS